MVFLSESYFAYASYECSSMTVHTCLLFCALTNRLYEKNPTRVSCLLYPLDQ